MAEATRLVTAPGPDSDLGGQPAASGLGSQTETSQVCTGHAHTEVAFVRSLDLTGCLCGVWGWGMVTPAGCGASPRGALERAEKWAGVDGRPMD